MPDPAAPDNSFLTLQQVARRLNMSDRWVRSQRQLGTLPVVRLGRRVRVRPEDLAAFVEERMGRRRARGVRP